MDDNNTLLGGQNGTDPAPTDDSTKVDNPGTNEPPTGGDDKGTPAPAVPEKYDFTDIGDELDDDVTASFSEVLKSVSATQEQAAAIAKYGVGYAQQVAEQVVAHQQEQAIKQSQEWAENTRKELGADLEPTLAKCGAAMEYLERYIPNIREVVNANGVGNQVEFVKVFAKVGELLAEDKGIGGNGSSSNQTAADILYGSK